MFAIAAGMSTFLQLYDEVVKTCSFVSMSDDLNQRLGLSCTLGDISTLIEKLESLDNADLIDDAGDMIDFYWRLRTSISDALVASGQKAVGPLLSALSKPNEQAAQYVARSLGLLKSKEAIEPIIRRMQAVTESADRLAYIAALGEIGDSRIIEVLVPYLSWPGEVNRGWLVRLSAVALGKTGNESVRDRLIDVLRDDVQWPARLGAAEGLGLLGSRKALPALHEALGDKDHRVAEAVKESISQIRSRKSWWRPRRDG